MLSPSALQRNLRVQLLRKSQLEYALYLQEGTEYKIKGGLQLCFPGGPGGAETASWTGERGLGRVHKKDKEEMDAGFNSGEGEGDSRTEEIP